MRLFVNIRHERTQRDVAYVATRSDCSMSFDHLVGAGEQRRRHDAPTALDSTLDHLAKDRLHVCLRKGSQRLRSNISKGTTAQSKRSHGNVIWCLDNRDDVVLA